MTIEIDGARCRPVQAEEQLQQRRLAAARGPGDRDEAAGLDIEVDVLEDELVGRAVAKTKVAHLDGAFHVQALGLRDVGFGNGGDDIRQAVEMQAEQAELNKLIDEAYGTIIERLAKRQEGKQHSDREALTGQDQSRSEKDYDDVDQSSQEGLNERHLDLIL